MLFPSAARPHLPGISRRRSPIATQRRTIEKRRLALASGSFQVGPRLALPATVGSDERFQFSPRRYYGTSSAGCAPGGARARWRRFSPRWVRRCGRLLRAFRLFDHRPAARRSPSQRLGVAHRLLCPPGTADPARCGADSVGDRYRGFLPAELPASARRSAGQPLRAGVRRELPLHGPWVGLLRPDGPALASPALLVTLGRGAVLSRLARGPLVRALRSVDPASPSSWNAAGPAAAVRRGAAHGSLVRLVPASNSHAAGGSVLL